MSSAISVVSLLFSIETNVHQAKRLVNWSFFSHQLVRRMTTAEIRLVASVAGFIRFWVDTFFLSQLFATFLFLLFCSAFWKTKGKNLIFFGKLFTAQVFFSPLFSIWDILILLPTIWWFMPCHACPPFIPFIRFHFFSLSLADCNLWRSLGLWQQQQHQLLQCLTGYSENLK